VLKARLISAAIMLPLVIYGVLFLPTDVFTLLLGLVLLAYFFTKIDRVLLFWVAFVLTRPFGATFGDLLTKPIANGGLNFGTIGSSLVLGGILVAFVVYTVRAERKVEQEVV